MSPKLPKWVRVLIYVPIDEEADIKCRLKQIDAGGADINWTAHGSWWPRSSAKENELRIEDESGGDVIAMSFTGQHLDGEPAAWAVMASAPVGRLTRLQRKYQHCDLRSMVKGIIRGHMMQMLNERPPYPEVVVIPGEPCQGK